MREYAMSHCRNPCPPANCQFPGKCECRCGLCNDTTKVSHAYTTELGNIAPGKPFMMVNYSGVFIRVAADKEYLIKRPAAMGMTEYSFNDDGNHVPIVELATGQLSYMSKMKPCLVYPGENYGR